MARKNARKKETSDVIMFDTRTKAVMAQVPQDGIKDKVAAVREVVPGKSNNEIILVLQHFDNNVEQAIQAYLEDGAAEALKEWHYPAKVTNKKKKKKADKQKTERAPGNDDNTPSEADTKASSLPTDAADRLSEVVSLEDWSVSPSAYSLPSLGATYNGAAYNGLSSYTETASVTSTSTVLSDIPDLTSSSSVEPQRSLPSRPTHIPLQNGMVDMATSTDDIPTYSDTKLVTDFNHNISVPITSKSVGTDVQPASKSVGTEAQPSVLSSQGARPKTNNKTVANGDSSSYKPKRDSYTNKPAQYSNSNVTSTRNTSTTGSYTSQKQHNSASKVAPPNAGNPKPSNNAPAKSPRRPPPKPASNLPSTAISSLITQHSNAPTAQQPQQTSRKKQRNQRTRKTSQGDKQGSASSAHGKKTASGQGQSGGQSSAPESDASASRPAPERSTSIDPVLENKIAAVGLERALKDLQRQTTSLQRLKLILDEEVDKAYKGITHIFDNMRDALNNREAELLFEMDKVRDQGRNVLKKRQNKAAELRKKINQAPSMSERDRAALRADIKLFVGDRKTDEDLCQTTRFVCQGERMVKDIDTFGEIVGIKNSYRQERPSMTSMTSHESNASSVTPLSPLSVLTPETTPSTPLSPMSSDALTSSGASSNSPSVSLGNPPLPLDKQPNLQEIAPRQEAHKDVPVVNGSTLVQVASNLAGSSARPSQTAIQEDASAAPSNESGKKQNNRRRRRKPRIVRDGEPMEEGSTDKPERPPQNPRNNPGNPYRNQSRNRDQRRPQPRQQGPEGSVNKGVQNRDAVDNRVKRENPVNSVANGVNGGSGDAKDVRQTERPREGYKGANEGNRGPRGGPKSPRHSGPNGPKISQHQNGPKHKDPNAIASNDNLGSEKVSKAKVAPENGPAINGTASNGHVTAEKKVDSGKDVSNETERTLDDTKQANVKRSVVSVSVKSLENNTEKAGAPLPQRQPRQRKNDVKRAEVVVNGKFDDEEER